MVMTTLKLPDEASYETNIAIHTLNMSKYISLPREFQKHLLYPSRINGVMYQVKYRKLYSQKKLNDNEYHVQGIKYVSHTSVKISCATTQFIEFTFCGTYIKPHGVRGLGNIIIYEQAPNWSVENLKYNIYPVHVWHVPSFKTIPGTLVCTSPENRDKNLLSNAHNGLCQDS